MKAGIKYLETGKPFTFFFYLINNAEDVTAHYLMEINTL